MPLTGPTPEERDQEMQRGCVWMLVVFLPFVGWMIWDGFSTLSVLLCLLAFSLIGLTNKIIHTRRHPDWLGGEIDAYEILDAIRQGEAFAPDVLTRWNELLPIQQEQAYDKILACILDHLAGEQGMTVEAFDGAIRSTFSALSLRFDLERVDESLRNRYRLVKLHQLLLAGASIKSIFYPLGVPLPPLGPEEIPYIGYASVSYYRPFSAALFKQVASGGLWAEGLPEEVYQQQMVKLEQGNQAFDSKGAFFITSTRILFYAGLREVSLPYGKLSDLRQLTDKMIALHPEEAELPLYFSPLDAQAILPLLRLLIKRAHS